MEYLNNSYDKSFINEDVLILPKLSLPFNPLKNATNEYVIQS